MPRLRREDTIISACMLCDIVIPDSQPSWADLRQVLRRQTKAFADEGFHAFVRPEIEFFLVESLITDGKPPVPMNNGGYFDQAIYDRAPRFHREAITVLEDTGIPVELSHHENAPGQQEVDLCYADPLTMVDNAMSFRYITKQIAVKNGIQATFISKPFQDLSGNGMYTHISLFEGDTNAFHGPDDEDRLSDTVKGFTADTLTHVDEISATTNQWTNSCKRIAFGDETSTSAIWGMANRSAPVRVPMYSPGKAHPRRVEIRSLDSACNSYLVYSVALAVDLKGIRESYQLPEQAEGNISELIKRERRTTGYRSLPAFLEVALQEMERSDLVADTFGDHIYEFFLLNKWREWRRFQRQVMQWELHTTLDY